MHLQTLSLKNFRSYKNQTLDFDQGFNFIFGRNAQGKTNLLEAIHFISYLKSFRTSTREDLIFNGEDQSLIEAKCYRDEVTDDIRIVLDINSRQVFLNGKKPTLLSNYYGILPVILFEPSEVYLFRDSPSKRRRFIDRALFLDDPQTLKVVRDYEEVVSQKNKLLKEGFFQNDELEIWNERLISLGARLIFNRLQWIERINPLLQKEYLSIANEDPQARIVYKSSFLQQAGSIDEITENLRLSINEKSDEEKRRRETLVGPHRDDWSFMIDERSMGDRGSQGENRSGVIALKAAQIKLYQQKHQQTPIFLLDDVISELDSRRSDALFDTLIKAHGQVFLTTTEAVKIPKNINSQGLSFLIENGRVV